jgi:hypothetical protein
MRKFIGYKLIQFIIGVNIIGLPEIHTHTKAVYQVQKHKPKFV